VREPRNGVEDPKRPNVGNPRPPRPPTRQRRTRPRVNPGLSDTSGFLKTGIFSFMLHVMLISLFALSSMSSVSKNSPSVYRVMLRPYSAGGGGGKVEPGGSRKSPSAGQPVSPSGETPKPDVASVKSEPMEKGTVSQKKTTKKAEKPDRGETVSPPRKEKSSEAPVERTFSSGTKKGEKPKKEKATEKSIQDAMDDIRRKQAMDEIQKRIVQRTKTEKGRPEGPTGERSASSQPTPRTTPNPVPASPREPSVSRPPAVPWGGPGTGPGTGPGSAPITSLPPGKGAGAGPGTGPGSGEGTGPGGVPGGVPWGSPSGTAAAGSRLDEYYGYIWAKIKEEWTLPESFPKGKADLETIIILVIERDGRLQNAWYDKRSGNTVYDQMAMRAIKKAAPFPHIPSEISENTLEIGIRFQPD
jgi:TonB family protein